MGGVVPLDQNIASVRWRSLGLRSRLAFSSGTGRALLLLNLMLANLPAQASAQPLVLFFGGYGANASDMRVWKEAARHDRGEQFEFEAIPYPAEAGADEKHAVVAAAATTGRLVRWLDSTPARRVFLVGHSAGAGLAASVLARLRQPGTVKLIVLDDALSVGFTPPAGFDPQTQMECWSAAAVGLSAVNRRETRTTCPRYLEMRAPRCRTPVCAHFYLVNRNAAPALDFPGSRRATPLGISAGYDRLDINLDWLPSGDQRSE